MRVGRIIAFAALLMTGLAALAVTVCGGGVLFLFVTTGGWTQGAFAIAGMGLGSVAIGSTVLFVVWRGIKLFRKGQN